MSEIPLNVGFFSVKSSSEEKSSTMKFFRLGVKNKTLKNKNNSSEDDPHKRNPSYLSSLPLSDIFFGLVFGVFTRCRTFK